MKVELNNNYNSNLNFGYALPKKKTYDAMRGYYSLITDKARYVEYSFLANQAKARLFNQKSQKTMEKYYSLVNNNLEENTIGMKTLMKNNILAISYRLKAAYEKAISAYYYYKL